MEINSLKLKLTKYGLVEVVKEGVVFTVFITGNGLSDWGNVQDIQKLVLDYAGKKYPLIEVMKNSENSFLIILKPQP